MSSSRRKFIKRTALVAGSLRTAGLAEYADSANIRPPQSAILVDQQFEAGCCSHKGEFNCQSGPELTAKPSG